jgi:hypothetical protein
LHSLQNLRYVSILELDLESSLANLPSARARSGPKAEHQNPVQLLAGHAYCISTLGRRVTMEPRNALITKEIFYSMKHVRRTDSARREAHGRKYEYSSLRSKRFNATDLNMAMLS